MATKGYNGLTEEKRIELSTLGGMEAALMEEREIIKRDISRQLDKKKRDYDLIEELRRKLKSTSRRIQECRERAQTLEAEDFIWTHVGGARNYA